MMAASALAVAAALLCRAPEAVAEARVWSFTEIAIPAGFNYTHGFDVMNEPRLNSGGVAVGDYNADGWDDIYVVRGNIGANLLFRNNGNGTFSEVGATAGVNVTGQDGSGPTFVDYDGDGWLDLFIGGVSPTAPRLYRNLGNGAFTNVTAACGIASFFNTYSSSWGDYDRDGDLDAFLTHWDILSSSGHLWRNEGDGTFSDVDIAAGLDVLTDSDGDYSFTGNWADIDNDDWPDLLVASDFNRSRVFVNDQDGTFTETTTTVLSDENGMGAAVADYDRDGDLDWFVSSIWDPNGVPEGTWGTSGNRLYRNTGNGVFEDVTDAAGVRRGYWGWGSSFGDFNNDGHLDLFHVNGWDAPEFAADSSRMFVSNGNGTFTENSKALGIAHTGQGRGIACFDFDHDGDLDVFIANNGQRPAFFRNDGGNALNWLRVEPRGIAPNNQAIGARILVTAGGVTQMWEVRAGSNYVSQDPANAHFGLGAATLATTVRVEWPNGQVTTLNNVAANQHLVVVHNPTGIVSELGAPAPAAAGLAAAPSFFSDRVALRVTVPATGGARLRILDASGRVVATLFDRAIEAGSFDAIWDGRDASGARAAPGVYFARLETGAAAASARISLVR
jgi:hypothetical protein